MKSTVETFINKQFCFVNGTNLSTFIFHQSVIEHITISVFPKVCLQLLKTYSEHSIVLVKISYDSVDRNVFQEANWFSLSAYSSQSVLDFIQIQKWCKLLNF